MFVCSRVLCVFVCSHVLCVCAPGCGGTLYGDHGSFTSPNYPDTYGNGSSCEWAIRAPVGRVVTVTFAQFSVDDPGDCQNNFLRLYDGPDATGRPVGPYCGAVRASLSVLYWLCIGQYILHTYIHTVHTYIHTYIHTVHTVHAYILYIHTYKQTNTESRVVNQPVFIYHCSTEPVQKSTRFLPPTGHFSCPGRPFKSHTHCETKARVISANNCRQLPDFLQL